MPSSVAYRPDMSPLQRVHELPEGSWEAIFFLVSKGEHDNETYDKTFTSAEGKSVFTYASALSYDWKQRGVTMGIVGFTTANDKKAAWGDAQPMLRRFHALGGPDLVKEADRAHTDKKHADALCKTIQALKGDEYNTFVEAQLDALCNKGGYMYETVHVLESCGIPVTPLAIAMVFDTLLNFGLGGRYCPVKWLQKHSMDSMDSMDVKDVDDPSRVLIQFLKFKALAGAKNNHNSCRHNAKARAGMFRRLVKRDAWSLPQSACERVVTWTMK